MRLLNTEVREVSAHSFTDPVLLTLTPEVICKYLGMSVQTLEHELQLIYNTEGVFDIAMAINKIIVDMDVEGAMRSYLVSHRPSRNTYVFKVNHWALV